MLPKSDLMSFDYKSLALPTILLCLTRRVSNQTRFYTKEILFFSTVDCMLYVILLDTELQIKPTHASIKSSGIRHHTFWQWKKSYCLSPLSLNLKIKLTEALRKKKTMNWHLLTKVTGTRWSGAMVESDLYCCIKPVPSSSRSCQDKRNTWSEFQNYGG